jgi:hypothetical protein
MSLNFFIWNEVGLLQIIKTKLYEKHYCFGVSVYGSFCRS